MPYHPGLAAEGGAGCTYCKKRFPKAFYQETVLSYHILLILQENFLKKGLDKREKEWYTC
jgi:hypothetical protein